MTILSQADLFNRNQAYTADRWIRRTTTATVLLLAGIAAVVSYTHMHTLVLQHGEGVWASALIPLSCDGMIVASSMALLSDSRLGGRGGVLPWTLLIVGALASLAANIAVAEPTLIGRVIAARPSLALTGAFTGRCVIDLACDLLFHVACMYVTVGVDVAVGQVVVLFVRGLRRCHAAVLWAGVCRRGVNDHAFPDLFPLGADVSHGFVDFPCSHGWVGGAGSGGRCWRERVLRSGRRADLRPRRRAWAWSAIEDQLSPM